MNRRKFFKGMGAVTATTIIAPHVVLAETPPVETITQSDGLWQQLQKAKCVYYDGSQRITRDMIKEAVEYVYKYYKPPTERFVRFETGSEGKKKIREQMHSYIINGITYTT